MCVGRLGGNSMSIQVKADSEKGVSLLELIIAVMILSIGTISIMRTLDIAQRQIGDAAPRYLAQTVAMNRAEEIRAIGWALGRGLPSVVKQGPIEWSIETQAKTAKGGLYEVTLLVTQPDGPGASMVIYSAWVP